MQGASAAACGCIGEKEPPRVRRNDPRVPVRGVWLMRSPRRRRRGDRPAPVGSDSRHNWAAIERESTCAMKTTESEAAFESFCEQYSLRYRRIVTSPEERRADYLLRAVPTSIVIEVKEIRPSKEEQQRYLEWQEDTKIDPPGDSLTCWVSDSIPGQQIRRKINKSGRQIRNITSNRRAGMLVLYATTWYVTPYEYDIKVGMFGFESIRFYVPQDPRQAPIPIKKHLGASKKMTKTCNTLIGAVAVLKKWPDDRWGLSIFHNHFATLPINPSCIKHPTVKQYRLSEAEDKGFPEWEEIQ